MEWAPQSLPASRRAGNRQILPKWLASHVQKGDATWRKPRSSSDRGNGKLRNCSYRGATTTKSPVNSTWRAARSRRTLIVCFCGLG